MGKLTQLWNPNGNHGLRRHWVRFEDRIVIGGESRAQAGPQLSATAADIKTEST